MDSSLIDPNNHVPAVTPGDIWDDHENGSQPARAPGIVLPSRKSKTEAQAAAPAGKQSVGLRIDVEPPVRRSADTPGQPLVVQQIDGQVVRLAPDDATVPRMPRLVTYQERPAGNGTKRPPGGEDKEWGLARRTPSLRWILGTSLGIASVVVLAMLLLPLINESNAARSLPGQTEFVLEKEEPLDGIDALNDMIIRQAEAEQVFKAYASATSIEEILPWVRDAASVAPLIRVHTHPALVPKAWIPPANTAWNVFENNGRAYGLLEGVLPNFTRFSAYVVVSNKHLRLDWKASTGYGTASFEELERNAGDATEIRASLQSSGYYTTVFPETLFQSYQLVSPGGNKSIWGYARRGEAAQIALGQLLSGGELEATDATSIKVTVRLGHGPAGALPNQWQITAMLHQDWLTP